VALWLKRNPIGVAGAQQVAEFLARHDQLRTLDLVQTELTSAGVLAIAKVLSRPGGTLRRLYLSGNGLGPEVAGALAELLRTNDTLEELYLGVNRLGDAGASIVLMQGLAMNGTLRRLSLASNGLGPATCAAITSALGQHPALIDLDLGYDRSTAIVGERANAIGDEGAELLAHWLSTDPPLRRLDVQHNGLTNLGAKQLCDAAEMSEHLLVLELGKGFAHGPKRRVHERLQQNRSCAPHDALMSDPDVQAIRSVYRTAATAGARIRPI
jgi:Ran GTPase-activating protein (RanGAP) involved in mRNA processing and transport